jgi:hypothetical protein
MGRCCCSDHKGYNHGTGGRRGVDYFEEEVDENDDTAAAAAAVDVDDDREAAMVHRHRHHHTKKVSYYFVDDAAAAAALPLFLRLFYLVGKSVTPVRATSLRARAATKLLFFSLLKLCFT